MPVNVWRHLDKPLPWLRIALLLLWTVVLAYLSLAPLVEVPGSVHPWDKVSHFTSYAVLALLLLGVLTPRRGLSAGLLGAAWLACAVVGLMLESLQWLMGAGRQWDSGDLLANALGALAGCVVFRHASMRSGGQDDR